ncbi:MAG: hypothetical protein ACD_4C00148G0002 [uncultured bacterium (gcode 4)]|uniref:Uncharacterized protein n=1 Tax=uncultured bacterium (gcode 4) TaxID=1234023 RepID=K2FV03_9BACT|nr:MAG: hypothetical protein ACD_4C00148G0002 [uncultured bacterium (gcode 4)]
MKKKVFIGITASQREVHVNISKKDITYISDDFLALIKYFDNVIPVILPVDIDPEHAKEIVEKLDGIILSSGEDIDPSIYKAVNLIKYDENISGLGEKYHRSLMFVPNIKRDFFEISLYKAAKEKNIPVIGICRGMQLINVAEEGTLYQENPDAGLIHFLGKDGWIHYHDIFLEKNSKIFEVFQIQKYTVCSIHHQSVEKLGKNLVISAKSEDGVVEVIEHKDYDFIIGIQGHIEKMTKNYPLYQKLIEKFIQNASIERVAYE